VYYEKRNSWKDFCCLWVWCVDWGTLVALSTNQMFWWIGTIIGAVIGYLTYEFKEVLRAIKIAWKTTIRIRPDWKSWKLLIKHFFWLYIFTLNLVPIGLAIAVLSEEKFNKVPAILSLMCQACLGVTVFVFFLSVSEMKTRSKDIVIENIKMFRSLTPFHVYLIYIPKIFYFLYRKGIPASVAFIKKVIVLIHSDIRLLCGFNAAIGTGIGYFAGSAIIGMLGGGFAGIFNYELISKRILHLVPKKIKT